MKSNSTITTNNVATSIRTPSSATKLTHHLSFLNGTPSQMADLKNSKAKIGSSSIGGIRRSFMFKSNQTASPKSRPFYPQRSHSTVSHLSCPQSELLKMKVVTSICPIFEMCCCALLLLASIFMFRFQSIRNQGSICKQ